MSAPVEVTPSLPCCPCDCGASVETIAEPIVTESLPCCPTGEVMGEVIDSGMVVESAPMMESVISEGEIISEGEVISEGEIMSEGEVMPSDEMVISNDVTWEGGETIISEEPIGMTGSSDSAAADSAAMESSDAVSEDSATPVGDAAEPEVSTDLFDSLTPSSDDGATYNKKSSKMRLVFVRTNLPKKRASAKPSAGKPVLRLSFSTATK